MSLPTQIRVVYPEITDSDFISLITLQDDGDGAYIKDWHHPDFPRPTAGSLEAVSARALELDAAALNPVPESVLSHQLFTALSRHGIDETTISAIINGMPKGQAKVEAGIAFRRAPQIRRDHPIALGIAMALSLSTETIDEIFREAAEI